MGTLQECVSGFSILFFSRCGPAEGPGEGVSAFDEPGPSRGNPIKSSLHDIDTLRTVPVGIGPPDPPFEASMPFREVGP